MEKKAKIIATLGPSIYKETELKKIIEIGVDAFRINFSLLLHHYQFILHFFMILEILKK